MTNTFNTKKIGIMGGTFNPIHYGHLLIAQYALEQYNLEKVLFITTGNPPHKEYNILEGVHRHNMTKIAIKDNPYFEAIDMEIKRSSTTYTIDTLNEIKAIYPNADIHFIIGMDALNQVFSWRNIDKVLQLCKFVVAKRPLYNMDTKAEFLIANHKDNFSFFYIPITSISSSEIRKRIKMGKNIKYLVKDVVLNYIYENNLYKKSYFKKYDETINLLKETLQEDRFNHTLETAKEAQKLATNYDFDEEKAFLSALLHDCAKNLNREEIFKTAEKYNFPMDEILQKQPDLAHSFLGVFLAKDIYGIEDANILNSIKYHTTGRKNMSILEKIIYIADYIEPNRKPFDSVFRARELAYKDLDKCMAYILKNSIQFNKNKNRIIHPLSFEAYNFYNNEKE